MIKLNSHATEIILNLTMTLDELKHLQCYVQHLVESINHSGFNSNLLLSYKKRISDIIEEVERNA